ncbi:MAG: hypothetical protein JNM84_18145 [Planctomycetes bacterium]|nr:hypothetical protein [Planctomycetota bacterium]
MQRRSFLAMTGLGGAQLCFGGGPSLASSSARGIYAALLERNDDALARQLERQQLDPSHPGHGGLPDEYELYHAGSAAGLLRDGAIALVSPESRYFRSALVRERLLLVTRFLRRAQHEDGTIDLLTTNFHSPPDTGFCVEWIAAACGLLRASARRDSDAALAALVEEIESFLTRAAQALTIGGVHTPNHRWVICMALARVNALLPDARYVERIDAWLAEGIDIDADGQYTERSTAIYSPLTNRCLLIVARLLGRPELLEPVRRNLAMSLHYLHADGEIATEGSRRQDQHRASSFARYYIAYRCLALADRDGRFAAAARWLERDFASELVGDLVFLVEDSALRAELPADAPLPTNFARHYAASDLVRIRRNALSATILGDNASFLSLHAGGAAVVMRCASAFFGKGQFVGDRVREQDGAWLMEQRLEGPYWQPLPPELRTGSNDWARIDRTTRTPSEVQRLHTTLSVRELREGEDHGLAVELAIEGTEGVPVAIELAFRAGGHFRGEHLRELGGARRVRLLESGHARYELGVDAIEFGPGRSSHRWTEIRGALPPLDGELVFLAGMTPFRTSLRLMARR